MRVALIGFGDLGQYMKQTFIEHFQLKAEDFICFDDKLHALNPLEAYPFSQYLDPPFQDYEFYVCLGYRHLELKRKIILELLTKGRKVPFFVHPSAYIHPSVSIGPGAFIYPGCSIDQNTTIGIGSWIANGDVVAHDCVIGDCCWFGASVTLSGQVKIGHETFVGSGSVLSNALTIGDNCIVGLGTVVTKNLGDNLSVIGNPMRILEKKLNLK